MIYLKEFLISVCFKNILSVQCLDNRLIESYYCDELLFAKYNCMLKGFHINSNAIINSNY